ncbi:S1 family peptidase [bacterium]|nr:S1 family peptidase [bacterium]
MALRLVFFVTLTSSFAHAGSGFGIQLIGGVAAPANQYQEVIRIHSEDGSCTATLVGPRLLVTAAHCGEVGEKVTFTFKGKSYTATIGRSALYEDYGHDLAVGLVDKAVADAKPMTIAGSVKEGDKMVLMGYGCTKTNGEGGNDGILRTGTTTVADFDAIQILSYSGEGEAALCFGDSGGPAFVKAGDKLTLVGVNSAGNIEDTNYNTRLDSEVSQKFFAAVVKKLKVDICGINKTCQ